MAQNDERQTTFLSILSSRAFRKGVSDYENGLPLDYGTIPKHFEYEYERGRQFAAWYRGRGRPMPPLRFGRGPNMEACLSLIYAFGEGAIL